MRSFTTEGIIIKRKNYGEADRVLTVYTKQHGKLLIKAIGVRKIISRRSPHVELLNHTILNLHQGKTYPILTEVETREIYSEIKDDLNKIGLAYHLCEIIDSLCPEREVHEEIFILLKDTLTRLSFEQDLKKVIHDFEISLLSLLGYWRGSVEIAKMLDTHSYIENIIERRLKSKRIFSLL